MEAASGFEPLSRGFADLRLSHLATPPRWWEPVDRKILERETGFEPATPTLARSCSTTELFPPASGTLARRRYSSHLAIVTQPGLRLPSCRFGSCPSTLR